jgi:CRP/FNR family transcriptional regulator, cyclic AMP receptor protein
LNSGILGASGCQLGKEHEMSETLAFLGILNEPDLEWLVANSKRQDIQSGTVLIRRDEPVEFLFLIVDGAFDVTVSAPKEHQVARLYAGELMGEMSFVDSHPSSATVTAGINSSVLAITQTDLIKKIENDSGFGARFYKGVSLLLSGRLRAAFAGEIDLHADPEGRDEMTALRTRFGEIQRRLELRRLAKGA